MRKAFLISTGSELLSFKINYYPPIFSQKLKRIGYDLIGEITTKDDINSIKEALYFASQKADLIIICGGLGPTFDDLTRAAVSEYLELPLVFSKKVKSFLTERYGSIEGKANLENQCYVLKNAILFENMTGTAFGQLISKDKKRYLLLPGPKKEWEGMWERIEVYIKSKKELYSLRFKVADIEEIELERILKEIITPKEASYTILAGPQICEFDVVSENKKTFEKVVKEIKDRISPYLYGFDDETLSAVIGKILTKKKLTLSIAESCTGGLLSSTITDTPGSSRYFIGGIIAYSNEIKVRFLGVKRETLNRYGAVSQQTAVEMVKGINRLFKTSASIAITGIAGPGGGSKEKPVGTVFIASLYNGKIDVVKKLFLNRDRRFIKEASVNTALWNLYKMVK